MWQGSQCLLVVYLTVLICLPQFVQDVYQDSTEHRYIISVKTSKVYPAVYLNRYMCQEVLRFIQLYLRGYDSYGMAHTSQRDLVLGQRKSLHMYNSYYNLVGVYSKNCFKKMVKNSRYTKTKVIWSWFIMFLASTFDSGY